jgi:hypothetical protein
MAESATGQNPTVLDTKSLKESVDVSLDVFMTANCTACEAGLCWKISRTPETLRFTGFRTPSTAPERWATGSGCIIIRARHGVTNARQIDTGDTSGGQEHCGIWHLGTWSCETWVCADQEKSECSTAISDTLGMGHVCRGVVCG